MEFSSDLICSVFGLLIGWALAMLSLVPFKKSKYKKRK